jgi:hypothetical protein
MPIDFDALVARLNEVVPEGFRVDRLMGGVNRITCPDGDCAQAGGSGHTADVGPATLEDYLSWVQDQVTMHFREPWPEYHRNLAMPQVRQDGHLLRLWYGTPTVVVLDVGEFEL